MYSEPVTGIILSGGKSSRFGVDKALYLYHEKRMVDYALEVVQPFCDELIVSTNKRGHSLFAGIRNVPDIYSDCGPLGGIHAGLLQSENEHNLIVGCDLPCLHPDLFRALINHKQGYQVVIPMHQEFKEPMASYFHKSTLPVIEDALKQKNVRILDVIPLLHTRFLNVEKMPFYSSKLFTNINSLRDIDEPKLPGK
jgi:molybdenum cofactor guanylyltransferase